MACIWPTAFWNTFTWMIIILFWFKFDCSLFPRPWAHISQHWSRKWLTSNRPIKYWRRSMTSYDVSMPQWVNTLVKPSRVNLLTAHDDVIKWKHFPRYWPFVRGIHRSPVNSLHKGQWRGALMFSLICAWINGWINNREAGDLRRYPAHYDVTLCEQGNVDAESNVNNMGNKHK